MQGGTSSALPEPPSSGRGRQASPSGPPPLVRDVGGASGTSLRVWLRRLAISGKTNSHTRAKPLLAATHGFLPMKLPLPEPPSRSGMLEAPAHPTKSAPRPPRFRVDPGAAHRYASGFEARGLGKTDSHTGRSPCLQRPVDFSRGGRRCRLERGRALRGQPPGPLLAAGAARRAPPLGVGGRRSRRRAGAAARGRKRVGRRGRAARGPARRGPRRAPPLAAVCAPPRVLRAQAAGAAP